MLHPILKTALEQSTGRDIFGKEFSDPNVVTPFGGSQAFRIDPETGQATPVDKVAPGLLESILRNFPQYGLAEDIAAGGAQYGTATLPQLLAGRLSGSHAGVIVDPETGQPKYPEGALEPLLGFSGFPVGDYDLAGYQQRLAEDAMAALRTWQNRQVPA
jgi:hypothetical protein